jgi:ABC-type antimicrobial peptide transport system permease subunit
MAEVLAQSTARVRFSTAVITLFGAMALVLVVFGVYGAMAYRIEQRTRDLDVRRAVGASSGAVLRLLLVSGSRIVAPGAVAGSFLSAVLARYMDHLVFGLATVEYPLVLFTVLALMGLITFTGSCMPAWRALRSEPAWLLH